MTPVRPSSDAGDLTPEELAQGVAIRQHVLTSSGMETRSIDARDVFKTDSDSGDLVKRLEDCAQQISEIESRGDWDGIAADIWEGAQKLAALSEENERLKAALRAEQSQSRMKY